MTLTLQEVARAMRAEGAPRPVEVAGWSVDTRTQNAGDVYFALRGPNYDGHNFIAAALEKGAAAVVVERRWVVPIAVPIGVPIDASIGERIGDPIGVQRGAQFAADEL